MENFWDKPNKAIDKIVGDRKVFYSVDKDMNEVAIEGTCRIVMPHDVWGSDGGEDYASPVVVNPTWIQLAVLADQGIRVCGDYHHIFFENVRCVGIELITGVQTYKFIMGS